jgi:anaerobic magnesium-protoporphyrin IX monomethyl ester cyclase
MDSPLLRKRLGEPRGKRLFRVIIPSYPKFNIYSYLVNKTTALGPIYIASSANELSEWEVEVIDENNFRKRNLIKDNGELNHELLQEARPADVVGFYGGMSSSIPRLYRLAKFYKGKGATTIAGGQHFVQETIPEALENGLDCVVIGEGEETVKELLSAISENKSWDGIQGIAFKQNEKIKYTSPRLPLKDLDKLPLPDFGLLKEARLLLFPLGRVRGCGMNCEFCAVKGAPRFASPEKLLEQIALNVEKFNAREFFIVDDLFAQDREATLKLCELLYRYQRKNHIKFRISVQIRLDKSKDTELLKAMKKAGIRVVIIGFESPIAEELKAMRKGLKHEEIYKLTQRYHEVGFYIHGMFIFGYPAKEGIPYQKNLEERIKAFKDFIKLTQLDTLQVLLPVPLPKTELRRRLAMQNRIYPLKYIGWEYYDGTFPLFEPDPPFTPQELQKAVLEIMSWFYNKKNYLKFNLNLLSFPLSMLKTDPKKGVGKWMRETRNLTFRVIGNRILERWRSQLKESDFPKKLELARASLRRQIH